MERAFVMRFRKRPKGEALESGETESGELERRPRKSAYNKMMDYLARRGFSEFELRQKLLQDYPEDDVNDAVARAREAGWILPPEEMAERVALELGRKRKGHRFINQFLKSKKACLPWPKMPTRSWPRPGSFSNRD